MSLEGIQAFLEGSEGVQFAGKGRKEMYAWVEKTLVGYEYASKPKAVKGLLRRYIEKMTGLQRAQVTRLITSYRKTGTVKARVYARHSFAKRYGKSDIDLLAYVDKAHGNLSGPATKRILEREFAVHHIAAYERVAKISSAQIYRLRATSEYRQCNISYQPTRPTGNAIGERRKPEPSGQPGFLRIDTVHQGDWEGHKGVYHINIVDQVTQWQVMAATPKISEYWLIPVLETLLQQFPFQLRGFHSDNGSEYINHDVAKMLSKLWIEQTKSRPRRSNDNGLVEAKNGAVIRKHLGYGHIEAQHAEAITTFYTAHLNPYVNFHRPCAVREMRALGNGRVEPVYRRWATPWELLQEVPKYQSCLGAGVTTNSLEKFAMEQSDTDAAVAMQAAKSEMFRQIGRQV